VFAVPPKVERILSDLARLDTALDVVLPTSAPRPHEWLSNEAFAFVPRLASGPYIVRSTTKPIAELEVLLEGASLSKTEVEGFAVFVPQSVFPWRVIGLAPHVAAFVPAREIGTGLAPLTAGRDLPPSEVEGELNKLLQAGARRPLLAIFAVGPMLHLDLSQDVAQYALSIAPWNQGGMDVEIRLAVTGDPTAAVEALEQREPSWETDVIKRLADRVAYSLADTVIEGRLQLTAEDVDALRKR
jgi:hypothetical protein